MSKKFHIKLPVNYLPPREICVIPITGAIDYNVEQQYNSIIIDYIIKDCTSISTITLDECPSFTVPANTSFSHSDIQVERIRVTGATDGFLILNIVNISDIRRLEALELD